MKLPTTTLTYTPPEVEVQALLSEQGFAASLSVKGHWFNPEEEVW